MFRKKLKISLLSTDELFTAKVCHDFRSYKNFDEKRFLAEVQKADFSCDSNDPNEQYDTLLQKFQSLIDIHAPIKQKTVRGNDAPFMNRDLRKAIYIRTRFKNKYNKNPNVENETKYKKQRNLCVNLRKKAIKKHLKEVTSNGIMENKSFWNTVKPFITNKSTLSNNTIMLKKDDSVVTKEKEIVEIFNNHYINIVEKSTGLKPNVLEEENGLHQIHDIIKKYQEHPSIVEIKKHATSDTFCFKEVSCENEVMKLFGEVKSNTSTGYDKILPKLFKLASQYLSKPLTKTINTSIKNSTFPSRAKIASVTPLDKGGKDKTDIGNYRPVSVLNVFSKIYEKIMKSQIMAYFDNQLSKFLSATEKAMEPNMY